VDFDVVCRWGGLPVDLSSDRGTLGWTIYRVAETWLARGEKGESRGFVDIEIAPIGEYLGRCLSIVVSLFLSSKCQPFKMDTAEPGPIAELFT
jgi:hypothetical protein